MTILHPTTVLMPTADPPPSQAASNNARLCLDATAEKLNDLTEQFRKYKELTNIKMQFMLAKNKIHNKMIAHLQARVNALKDKLEFVDDQPTSSELMAPQLNLAPNGQSMPIADMPGNFPI